MINIFFLNNNFQVLELWWIVHPPLVSAIRPGSWGGIITLPLLIEAKYFRRTTRGQTGLHNSLAQTMLTHQAQSCKTKTNIYLYKHALLFCFWRISSALPCLHAKSNAEGRSSGLRCRPLWPWTCCLQSLWVPALLSSLRGCKLSGRPTDPGVQRLPSTSFHWSKQPPVTTARLTPVWLDWTAAVCVTVRTWPPRSGTRRLLWSSRRSLRSRPVTRERLPVDLYFALMTTKWQVCCRWNGTNFRRCLPYWEEE